jgi:hypothetical protein
MQCCGSGSASGSVLFWAYRIRIQIRFSHKYGSGSGSFYHQAKKVRKTLISVFCDFFMTFISVQDPDPYVYGPPGSVRQGYISQDPDPDPDPYQNVTDPQHSDTGTFFVRISPRNLNRFSSVHISSESPRGGKNWKKLSFY